MTTNPDSILSSIKKTVGFDDEFTAFDVDITLHINAAFGELQQLGVGGDTGFVITDDTTLWSQYVSDFTYQGMVKQYVYLFTKLAFDPPITSFGLDALQKQQEKLAWRINSAAEHINPPDNPFTEGVVSEADTVNQLFFEVKTKVLEFAATITPDAGRANTFYLTMTHFCTINAPVNGSDGEHINLELTSNGHAVTWGPGWNWGLSGEPDLSSGGLTDMISAVWRESSNDWVAGFTPGF
jgi:hypothetical protein